LYTVRMALVTYNQGHAKTHCRTNR
jgi:hypothetical protein